METSGTRKILCINPLVMVVDDFFDQNLAQRVAEVGEATLQRAQVVDSEQGGEMMEDSRSNDAGVVNQWSDPEITSLVTRIANVVRLPPENAETTQLLRYRGQQKFDPHFDGFDNSVGGLQCLSQGGQRLFTTICYLNDVESGGETEFPELKLRVAPKLGRVLVFGNTRLGTAEIHPHSLHGGCPVNAGEKLVLSVWWRQLAYHVQREYPSEVGDVETIN